jgi:hypothetical protein
LREKKREIKKHLLVGAPVRLFLFLHTVIFHLGQFILFLL